MKLNYITAFLLAVIFSTSAFAQTVVETTTKSTSDVTTDGKTIVISPPTSAISPTIGSSTSDLCMSGVSGAVQTQILGISSGEMVRDQNCERLKISKTLYDMGKAAILRNGTAIEQITLDMPNVHNIPFDLTKYGFPADKPGVSPTIFFPIDEPHGMIKATIHANNIVSGGHGGVRSRM